MWYVYVLQSEKTGRYYIGYTEDVEKRVRQHNGGKTKSLKAYIPLRLVYSETFSKRREAYKRELKIKSYKGGDAFKRLIND